MGHILGISAGFHDAAASVIDRDGNILFAAHSERYSKKKNDAEISPSLIRELLTYPIDSVAFYERPWMHNLQQWRSGQKLYGPWTARSAVQRYLGPDFASGVDYCCFPHHLSHAAAGFQTSPFERAAVVVIDAIGEMDTISIYRASYDRRSRAQYRRMWRQRYPHSIGLFYSAVTQAVGLRPMDEEYITMGMAAYGSDSGHRRLSHWLIKDLARAEFRENLHLGLDESITKSWKKESLAASAQRVTETMVMSIMKMARQITGEPNLVYMGGVALNCVANSRLGQVFDHIWIMPNPGDAGSSLGAAALCLGNRLHWQHAFLGHNIPGAYPVEAIMQELTTRRIVGVASGRAEFGPRALGNRSLLADPRGADIKDRVNDIKRRQKFRPFAPIILAEMASQYFSMPRGWSRSDYMQTVAQCRRPDLYPAICHVDDTSRVQTVPNDGSGIRQLLEQWYAVTGCPMLLNTSLNVRGEPMVNSRQDADRFQSLYGVKVCS